MQWATIFSYDNFVFALDVVDWVVLRLYITNIYLFDLTKFHMNILHIRS